MYLDFDWHVQLIDAAKLAIAFILALPIGWFREKEGHGVGLRTFPLVAMASCGYVLLVMPNGGETLEAQSRVIQGLVAGIGFIGGGAILRARGNIRGTAAAASIWNTGVLGASVAQERWILAVALALINLITLRVLLPLKLKARERAEPGDEG